MAIQKPEWFPMDPAKFLSDSVVDSMSATELGAAIRLLCRQWIDGSLPDDLRTLARLSRLDDIEMAEAWVVLQRFFPEVEPGKRANRFMWIKRETVIAELERKSDDFTRLARKRWDATRNAAHSAGGNAERNAARIPAAMPAAMQEQSREEQSREEQRGTDAPAMPDAVRTASGDGAPPGLHVVQYAKGLMENLNMVATSADMPIVAEAIRLLAKDAGIDEAPATDRMFQLAGAARERGETVDRFWFTDGRWSAAAQPKGKSKLEQRMDQSLAAIDRA